MIVHFLIFYLLLPAAIVIAIVVTINRRVGGKGAAAGMRGESLPARIWQTVAGLLRELAGRFGAPQLMPATAAAPPPATPAGGPRRQPPPLAAIPDNVAHPAEIAAVQSAGIPAPWRALISYIADFEPDNAGEYIAHERGNSAGFLALAEAYRDSADTMLNQIGLDPAVVHSKLDMADIVADGAQGANLVVRKFLIVYGHILESDTQLPHNAREWLTGGDA